MESNAEEVVTEVIDYTVDLQVIQEQLQEVQIALNEANGLLGYTCGFLLFFVVVALCVFGYKFIKMFF